MAFDDPASLISTAYAYTTVILQNALNDRGHAVLLGAGGSTPGPLYARLSDTSLEWDRVTIGLTDERWVPANHPASNERLMRACLHQNKAGAATFLPMVTKAETSPFDETTSVQALYADPAENCDIMILGMGLDAHTLSWFPEAEGLANALDPQNKSIVAAIKARESHVTGEHTLRMTLTLPAITAAKHILLLITGHEKRDVLETAGPGTPIARMIQAAADRLSIYWAP